MAITKEKFKIALYKKLVLEGFPTDADPLIETLGGNDVDLDF